MESPSKLARRDSKSTPEVQEAIRSASNYADKIFRVKPGQNKCILQSTNNVQRSRNVRKRALRTKPTLRQYRTAHRRPTSAMAGRGGSHSLDPPSAPGSSLAYVSTGHHVASA
eukprot:710862-Rhodomonas_salina.1